MDIVRTKKLFNEVSNINTLPSMVEIMKAVGEDEYEELMVDISTGCHFILKDNTSIELSKNYICIMHPTYDVDSFEVYEIMDVELFVCANCLEKLNLRTSILMQFEKFKDMAYELLFPIHWTDAGVQTWCKKSQKKSNEKGNYLTEPK